LWLNKMKISLMSLLCLILSLKWLCNTSLFFLWIYDIFYLCSFLQLTSLKTYLHPNLHIHYLF
jgi:hypothetical protein